jgi:membrane protease YdiL (CAAX protease family)
MNSTMSTVTPAGFLPSVTATRWRLSVAGVLAVLVPLSLVAADVLASTVGPGPDILVGLCLIGILAVVARLAGLRPDDLGLARSTWAAGLRWGLGAAALVGTGYAAALAITPLRASVADVGAPTWSAAMVSAVILIPLGTVIHEEFAFRGLLFGVLRRRSGRRVAMLGSSVVFGFWHIVPALPAGPTNAAIADAVGEGFGGTVLRLAGTVLVTGLGGVVLCELRVRSGSLVAPILLHWAVNAGGVLFVLLA